MHTPHPRRIQQRRGVRGWRKPEGAKSVARPGRYGNPFTVEYALADGHAATVMEARAVCVTAFAEWLDTGRCAWPVEGSEQRRRRLLDGLPELVDATAVMCFCDLDGPCHGDVIVARVEQLRAAV